MFLPQKNKNNEEFSVKNDEIWLNLHVQVQFLWQR